MIKLGFLLNLSRLKHWLLDKAFSILVWNRSVLEALFRRHSCKGHRTAASLVWPKELILKATTFNIQNVAILPLELLWVCKAWNIGEEGGERSNWGFIFESEHPGSEGKSSEQEEAVAWFCETELCRNFIDDRFSIHLLFVFSLVVWDKGRNLGPKVKGLDHTYLIQQGKNAERISLYQVKAVLVVLVVYEWPLQALSCIFFLKEEGKGLFCSRGHQSSELCALGSWSRSCLRS